MFILNDDTLPSVITDSTRWRKLLVEVNSRVSLKYMNDKLGHIGFRPDAVAKTITIFSLADTARKSLLHYIQPAKDELIFRGRLRNGSIYVHLKRFDHNDFLLLKRGCHWINERPFSR